jgi:glycerophosphoryl diester phosphodiesterase
MFRKITAAFLLLAGALLLVAVVRDVWMHSTDALGRISMGLPVVAVAVLDGLAGRRMLARKAPKRSRPLAVFLLSSLSLALVSYVGAVAYVDHQLARRDYPGVFDDCHKVWGARGLVLAEPQIVRHGMQNTIESVTLAFDEGATGCEVDVFFDGELGHFIVSHDRPYHLKNGQLLFLEELLAAVGQRGYIWLDFKKLRKLDETELAAAVAELLDLTRRHGDPQRMYVEGEDPLNLSAFRDAGFPTILDTHPLTDAHFLTPALINLYKLLYYFGDFTVMAMNYGKLEDPIYGERTRDRLGRLPRFIYHVEDDQAVLASLAMDAAVRVILVNDQSLNRYGLNGCP